MFHPLLDNPRKLKDEDLEGKILDLGRKYQIALRLGNGSAAQQIVMALGMYKEEQQRRQHEAMQSTMTKQNKGLDDLINIE